jgi:hypothetical protein
MMNIFHRYVETGLTVYVVLRDIATANVWTGSEFVAQVNANWATYAWPATETPSGGYHYVAAVTNPPAGRYMAEIYSRAGASPAVSDAQIGRTDIIEWSGSAELSPADAVDASTTGQTVAENLDAPVSACAEPGDEMAMTAAQVIALVAAIEAEIVDDETGEAVKQAIIDKLLENLPDIDDLTLSAIASACAPACRDAILDRVLAGNHDAAGTPGKLLQTIQQNVGGLNGEVMRGTNGAYTGTPPTADAIGTNAAAKVLAAPANKLATNATGQVEASNMRGTNGAYTGTPPTVQQIDAQLSGAHGAGSWQRDAGAGATAQTYTVTDAEDLPVEGVSVRVTTDAAGANTIAAGVTDTAGEFTFYHDLPSGTTVYVWRSKAGQTFTPPNPDTETIP